MFVIREIITFNNYGTCVEAEIVFWAFGIDKFSLGNKTVAGGSSYISLQNGRAIYMKFIETRF